MYYVSIYQISKLSNDYHAWNFTCIFDLLYNRLDSQIFQT